MSCETSCCLFSRGEFYIGDSSSICSADVSGLICGGESPLKKIGNIDTASITISSTILGAENRYLPLKDPESRIAIQSIGLNLTLLCPKNINMKQGLFSLDYEGDEVLDFVQEFTLCNSEALSECNFFKFSHFGVDKESLVLLVLDEDSEVLATLEEGVDYIVNDHGVEILRDLFYTGQTFLRFVYDYNDTGAQEYGFLDQFKGYKYLYFKGTNYGDDSNSPFGVEIYKVLFNPVSQLDLISQGSYFVINLTGIIEKDFKREEELLDTYFKIRRI